MGDGLVEIGVEWGLEYDGEASDVCRSSGHHSGAGVCSKRWVRVVQKNGGSLCPCGRYEGSPI